MAAQSDFWGDLQATAIPRTPAAILKEQAALLGEKTSHVLEGRVSTHSSNGDFIHFFEIAVPSLSYTYRLFRIDHGIALYPLVADQSQRLDSEDALNDWLRVKLSAPETRKIIGSLLAQANN
jgi:hypothetical protein